MPDEFELEAVFLGDAKSPGLLDAAGKRWRKILPEGKPVSIGRAAKDQMEVPEWKRSDWVIPNKEDIYVSGCHVIVTAADGAVTVKVRDKGPGEEHEPIIKVGKERVSEATLKPGDSFFAGNHQFAVHKRRIDGPVYLASLPMQAQDRKPFQESKKNLETLRKLTRLLHDASADRFNDAFLKELLDGFPDARWTALIELRPTYDGAADYVVAKQGAKNREEEAFVPSHTLLARTHATMKNSEFALWGGSTLGSLRKGRDWAVCVPVPELREDKRLALYAEGKLPGIPEASVFVEREMQDFTGVLQIAARLHQSRQRSDYYQGLSDSMRPFLAGTLRTMLENEADPKLMHPRPLPIASLIGDIRGSCHISEDNVEELDRAMRRISAALANLTGAITASGGTVGGLQGDAAMGFWGWPGGAEEHPIEQAIKAIRRIRQTSENVNDPLWRGGDSVARGVQFGLGLAFGTAIAGVIGTPEYRRADVFGPVVNLAARLEGMTKTLGVPVAVDEAVANHVQGPHRVAGGQARAVWLGTYRPAGMEAPIRVFELLPEGVKPGIASGEDVRQWESAMRCVFQENDWAEAKERLLEFEAHKHFGILAKHLCDLMGAYDWNAKHPHVCSTGSFAIDKAGRIHAG